MRPIAHGIFTALLIGGVLAVTAAAPAKKATAKTSSQKTSVGEYVDIKLPIKGPLASQWVVQVHGDEMQIFPATAQLEGDGTVISALVQKNDPDTLQAVLVVTPDGNTISTPLRAKK